MLPKARGKRTLFTSNGDKFQRFVKFIFNAIRCALQGSLDGYLVHQTAEASSLSVLRPVMRNSEYALRAI